MAEKAVPDSEVKLWASLGTTIATRQYENVKIDIGITGVPIDVSEEHLKVLLEGANVTLERMIHSLADELGRRISEVVPNRSS